MSTKLYVGNLAFQTTSQELQELFASAGTVESAAVVEDRDTGRSRGFGFVEMSTKEEATSAIDQFNGKELGGRALKVNEAKPRENRAGGGGGRGGSVVLAAAQRWRPTAVTASPLVIVRKQCESNNTARFLWSVVKDVGPDPAASKK